MVLYIWDRGEQTYKLEMGPYSCRNFLGDLLLQRSTYEMNLEIISFLHKVLYPDFKTLNTGVALDTATELTPVASSLCTRALAFTCKSSMDSVSATSTPASFSIRSRDTLDNFWSQAGDLLLGQWQSDPEQEIALTPIQGARKPRYPAYWLAELTTQSIVPRSAASMRSTAPSCLTLGRRAGSHLVQCWYSVLLLMSTPMATMSNEAARPGLHRNQSFNLTDVNSRWRRPFSLFINSFLVVATGAPYALKLQCDWPGTRAGMEPATRSASIPLPYPRASEAHYFKGITENLRSTLLRAHEEGLNKWLYTPLYEPGSTPAQSEKAFQAEAPTTAGVSEGAFHDWPATRGGRYIGCAAVVIRIARHSLRHQVRGTVQSAELYKSDVTVPRVTSRGRSLSRDGWYHRVEDQRSAAANQATSVLIAQPCSGNTEHTLRPAEQRARSFLAETPSGQDGATTILRADEGEEGEYGAAPECKKKRRGVTGDSRENPPTSEIFPLDSHKRKSGTDLDVSGARFPLVGRAQKKDVGGNSFRDRRPESRRPPRDLRDWRENNLAMKKIFQRAVSSKISRTPRRNALTTLDFCNILQSRNSSNPLEQLGFCAITEITTVKCRWVERGVRDQCDNRMEWFRLSTAMGSHFLPKGWLVEPRFRLRCDSGQAVPLIALQAIKQNSAATNPALLAALIGYCGHRRFPNCHDMSLDGAQRRLWSAYSLSLDKTTRLAGGLPERP
ncbi:hypothetical protein PR048_003127 [Dryococelus australis]|uniref:Uncharacterized protein n=1 Tax=Dryococelus australis TaxID=614101 RepID=A0ABQ9IM68_9NEOP|nr:hypothetical protein PR048_003127 [Dryococelus australis]